MRHGFVIVTRALIMGRFGMLQCKANFSYGSKNKNCDTCKVLEDKNHRINECILYKDINLYNSDTKINFESIHSKTMSTSMSVIEIILKMWDLGNERNMMRT